MNINTLPDEIQAQIKNLHFETITSRMSDLTNQQFGHLTVLGLAGRQGHHALWWVICDCSKHTIFSIRGDQLAGRTSCGCAKPPKAGTRNSNLVGQTFNRLTVISQEEGRANNGNLLWRCKCQCGNEIIVPTTSLTGGNTKSCGCLKRENAHFATLSEDLTGRTFGHLTVIEKTPKRQYGKVVWRCQCGCGNEVYLNTTRLTQGNDISCGCSKKSYGATEIERLLHTANISFVSEFCIKELNNKRFDFALIDKCHRPYRFIEYDGEQHYRSTGGWNTLEQVSLTKERDKQKNEYASSHSIPLVRIPYWERDKITLDMILGDRYLVKE